MLVARVAVIRFNFYPRNMDPSVTARVYAVPITTICSLCTLGTCVHVCVYFTVFSHI